MKEPANMRRYLWMLWGSIGAFVFYEEFKAYYARMSQPLEGVNYTDYLRIRA